MEYLLYAIIGVIVVIVVSTMTRSTPRPTPSSSPIDDEPRVEAEPEVEVKFTAGDVLAQLVSLQKRSAQWPEILTVLNPHGDPSVQALLIQIRQPHLGCPRTGMNVLEVGARSVPESDEAIKAFEAAVDETNKAIGYGN